MGRLADLLREVESEAEEEPKAPEDARALFSKTFSKVCGPDAASLNSSQFVEVFQLLGIALDRVEAEELFEAFATIAATHTGPATISIEDAQRALAHCGAHDDGAVVRALRPHNLKRNQSGRKSSIIVYEANLDPDRGLQQSMGVSNIVSVCLDGLPEKGEKGPFGDQRWCVLLFLEGSEVDEWGQPVGATECSMATCTPVYIRCFLIGDKCKRRLKFQIANCKKDDNLVPVLSSCTAFAEATCTMEQLLTSPNMRLELGARVAPEFAALAPTPAQVNLFATQFAESSEGLIEFTFIVNEMNPLGKKAPSACFIQVMRRHASGQFLPIAQSKDAEKTKTPAWRFIIPVIDLTADTRRPYEEALMLRLYHHKRDGRCLVLGTWTGLLKEGETKIDLEREGCVVSARMMVVCKNKDGPA